MPDVDLNQVTKSRKSKKIRLDGSTSGVNKKIVFNDDGEEEADTGLIGDDSLNLSASNEKNFDYVAIANEDFIGHVRRRLGETSEQDRAEEKQRIREKHRKTRNQEKEDKEDGAEGEQGAMLATLGELSEEDEDTSVIGVGSRNSGSDTDSEDDMNVRQQEDLALSMIRSR